MAVSSEAKISKFLMPDCRIKKMFITFVLQTIKIMDGYFQQDPFATNFVV